jgi:hypothetical protein
MQDASFKKGFSVPEENRDTLRFLSGETVQTNVSTARKSPATKLISALNPKCVENVPKKAITKPSAWKPSSNASHVEDPTNRLVETVGN